MVLIVKSTESKIIWEMCACLGGIILIILIGVGRLTYCGWYSLVGILGHISREGELKNMPAFIALFWLWLSCEQQLQARAALNSLHDGLYLELWAKTNVISLKLFLFRVFFHSKRKITKTQIKSVLTLVVGDFNTYSTLALRQVIWTKQTEISELNDIIEQMGIIDIYRAFHQNATKHIFFSTAHGIFSK